MGYSTTIGAFNQVQVYLDVLRSTKTNEVKWTPDEGVKPEALNYSIHRGLASAERYNIPGYADLRGKWKIKLSEGKIIAVRRVIPKGSINLVATDAMDLVSQALGFEDVKQPLIFPMLDSESEINDVKAWAKNEERVKLIIMTDKIIVEWRG